jgi:hypothetical protein
MSTKNLKIEINGASQSVSIILSDDDERINGFVESVEDLKTLKVIQEGFGAKINMKGSEGQPVDVSINGPSNDDLSAVLHKLRPLILTNEPFFFHRVTNIIAKSTKGTPIGSFIKEQKTLFDGKRTQELFRIKVGELALNSDEAVDQWLNAYQYHRDVDYRRMFKDLYQAVPSSFCEGLFIQMIVDKVKAILAVSEIMKTVLGIRKNVKIAVSA